MVTAALIGGIGDLVTRERRWCSWESALLGAGVSTVSALGGYLLLTARRHRG